ncbi:6-phosphogluconate dehydrogenase C-terminal domain-like protein [Thozetella sp. PMI_491]|nr:6-phosphogluconate dehydrogenase C-terminal domain-like protein [Thozetella sp. PMI_491]
MASHAPLPCPRGVDPDASPPSPRLWAWTPENLPGTPGTPAPEAGGGTRVVSEAVAGSSRRIFILGVGNLGRLYASALASLPDRPPITLVVHRRALLEQWLAHPAIQITRSGVTDHATSFDIEWWTEERPATGLAREVSGGSKIRNLIIATKAPDALVQADRVRRYLDSHSTVAFVQNGMSRLWPPDGLAYSSKRYPPGQHPNWVACITMHGVYSTGPFASVHASPADVSVGHVLPNPETREDAGYLVQQIVTAPHLAARAVARPMLWVLQLEKLVVNSVINPLTAILRCRNGQLFANPGGNVERVVELLLEEASCVLQALARHDAAIEILSDEQPSAAATDVYASQTAMVERVSYARLREMLFRVGEKVKDNISSMLQDVRAGKPTEISEFNGWIVDTAKSLGNLDVTNHETIIRLVQDGATLGEEDLGKYFPLAKAPSP